MHSLLIFKAVLLVFLGGVLRGSKASCKHSRVIILEQLPMYISSRHRSMLACIYICTSGNPTNIYSPCNSFLAITNSCLALELSLADKCSTTLTKLSITCIPFTPDNKPAKSNPKGATGTHSRIKWLQCHRYSLAPALVSCEGNMHRDGHANVCPFTLPVMPCIEIPEVGTYLVLSSIAIEAALRHHLVSVNWKRNACIHSWFGHKCNFSVIWCWADGVWFVCQRFFQ